MRRLEQRFGQALLEHHREGISLTEAGERLLGHVDEMDRAARPIEEGRSATASLSGRLRISVAEGFGTWFLASHLHEFCSANPDLVVELVANSGFLNPSKRETDIAIMLAKPKGGPLVVRRLTDYTLHLYAARNYLVSAPPVHYVADLHRHTLVGYVPDLLYAPELRYLGEIEKALVPTVQSSSINAQHRLIAAKAGIGVLPDFIGGRDAELVRLLPEKQITRSFFSVVHDDNRRLRRVVSFLEWVGALLSREQSSIVQNT